MDEHEHTEQDSGITMRTYSSRDGNASSHGTTVDRVVAQLREGVMNGTLPPGQRLVEADLTRDYRISRGPVREALRRLSAEGLVELVPNRGAVVRRLSYRETIELFEIRLPLECQAARLATAAIDRNDNRARFNAAITPIWSDAPRRYGTAYHEENREFHEAVFAICGNRQLADLCRRLQLPLIMLQLSGVMTPEMYADSVAEHREIARCILAGDGEGAAAVVWQHLRRAQGIVEHMPASTFRQDDDD